MMSPAPGISLIVAASSNDVIGRDGQLPWHLPDDLRRFRQLTTGKPIVMGRKTWESIGRPLPGRQNIVMTRDPGYVAPGCDVVTSKEAALAAASGAAEIMIIGGRAIYDAFLPIAERIYLTRVHADVDGDVVFPTLPADEWERLSLEAHGKDDRHAHAFDFEVLRRRVTRPQEDPGRRYA